MTPVVSVIIPSDRVEESLRLCLASLTRQRDAPPFEVLVASSVPPGSVGAAPFDLWWIEMAERNPASRRNAAAKQARGSVLAFLDDDATAEPDWLSAGYRALERSPIAGGLDLGPVSAPYAERISDLLLSTPWIGSGVPAHQRRPRGGPLRSPHDVALCNLFVRRRTFEALDGFDESFGYIGEDTDFIRRAMETGELAELDPSVRVAHRRRPFPGAYVAQRWAYRVKTGRLLIEKPGLHDRGRIVAFLAAGFLATAGAALFGGAFLGPAALTYAAATWGFSFPIWRGDPLLSPAVPFAFALHHLTYFAGLLAGIARGAFALAAAGDRVTVPR